MNFEKTQQPNSGNAGMPGDRIQLSDSEYRISQSQSYRSLVRAHRAMSWRLFWLITASVLLFDIAASFAPELISAPVLSGALFNVGFAMAFGAIALIFAVSLFYLNWVNQYRNRIDQGKPPK